MAHESLFYFWGDLYGRGLPRASDSEVFETDEVSRVEGVGVYPNRFA